MEQRKFTGWDVTVCRGAGLSDEVPRLVRCSVEDVTNGRGLPREM